MFIKKQCHRYKALSDTEYKIITKSQYKKSVEAISLQRYSGHRALISPDATKSYINCSFNAGNELDLHVSQQSQNNDHQMHLFLCVDCSLPHIGLIFYRKRPGNKVSRMRRPGYVSIRVAWAAYKKI